MAATSASYRRRARARPRVRRRVRWDRIARLSLLVVLVVVLASYVGPLVNYLDSGRQAKEGRAELRDLRGEHRTLRKRARRLRDPEVLELEARKVGMARPGERPYVIRNLPKGR